MGLVLPYKRRTLERQRRNDAFDGTAGRGLYNFDQWQADAGLPPGDNFTLMLRVWFTAPAPVGDVLLQFVNPDDSTSADRMVILEDTTGLLESFVEDNLGQWWVVPNRSSRALPWELRFSTTVDVATATLNCEIAWVPNWPCSMRQLQQMLSYQG